jgi:transposase
MAAKVWNSTKQKRLDEMYESGEYSTREMAKDLGVTQRTVYNQFHRLGWTTGKLPRRPNPPGKVAFSEQEDQVITACKKKGIYSTMIAQKLGKPRMAVGRRIRELGLSNSNVLPLPIGKRYTSLLVLGASEPVLNPKTGYRIGCSLVKCDCGREVTVANHALRCRNTRSCGCKIQSRNPDTPWIRVFHQYQGGALLRNINWDLTLEQLKSICLMPCQYCRSEPSNTQRAPNGTVTLKYTGIDQIQPCGGYFLGNVVPCCTVCNRAKSNLSLQQFTDWLNSIGSTITTHQVVEEALRIKDELASPSETGMASTLSFRKARALDRTNPELLRRSKRLADLQL